MSDFVNIKLIKWLIKSLLYLLIEQQYKIQGLIAWNNIKLKLFFCEKKFFVNLIWNEMKLFFY